MKLKKQTNRFIAPGLVASSGQLNIFADGWDKLPWWNADFRSNVKYMDPRLLKKVKKSLMFQYPQTIALGFSINILKNLRAETSGEISLKQFANLDGRQSAYNLGYRVGQCLEWEIMKAIKVSAGYLYNNTGVKNNKRNDADPLLDYHTVAGGLKLNINEYVDVTWGMFYNIYVPQKVRTVDYVFSGGLNANHWTDRKYKEQRWSMAVGLTAHLFGNKVKTGEAKEEKQM
jgi:long-subunit fatty acid transport protein